MDVLIRLLARFILVPLGYIAAVVVGACVILLGSWKFAEMLVSSNQDVFAYGVLGFAIAGPVMFIMLFSVMWLPGAIGVVISEAFAIRSWIFHALNGAVSAWLGSQMLAPLNNMGEPINETTMIFGAGLAGGFAYWAVAGWSAGFWKPVFRERYAPAAIPLPNPPPQAGEGRRSEINPPAQTKV
jgi:hypothetical protein